MEFPTGADLESRYPAVGYDADVVMLRIQIQSRFRHEGF
jgi:hypothetical protein